MNTHRFMFSMWNGSMLFFLYAPVFLLIVFSFNASPMSVHWQGASLAWYRQLLSDVALIEATRNSLIVALTSTLMAVVMGTGVALVFERHRRWRSPILQTALMLPLVIPEILMGVALLLFFVMVDIPLGLLTVTIGHLAFNLPLVILVIRARLRKIDPSLEEAARDLGATRWQVVRRITLPLLRPAIAGSALMAFTLSLDDFVVTFFIAGPGATTLPLKVFSMIKTGITPEVNALSAVLVVISMALIGLAFMMQHNTSTQSMQDKRG